MARKFIFVLAFALLAATGARAGEADVVDANATRTGETWRFDVTVRHDDTGWDHYADKWDVLAPGGAVLGTRVLLHPHENEQPFTRSLTGIELSDGIDTVIIRAHDSVDGYGGLEHTLELQR